MRITDPNARRVRKGAYVMFKTILGPLAIGVIQKRRGEHIEVHYGEGNEAAMYLEDVVGVLSNRWRRNHG